QLVNRPAAGELLRRLTIVIALDDEDAQRAVSDAIQVRERLAAEVVDRQREVALHGVWFVPVEDLVDGDALQHVLRFEARVARIARQRSGTRSEPRQRRP